MENAIVIGAVAVGVLAVLFTLIGMVTPNWVTGTGYHAGLYVFCNEVVDTCISLEGDLVSSKLAATRAFMAIGLICGIGAMITSLVYYCKFVKNNEANRNLPLVMGVLFVVSGLSCLLGIIIIASDDDDTGGSGDMGYSFGMAIIGALFALVAGGLTLFHRSKIDSS